MVGFRRREQQVESLLFARHGRFKRGDIMIITCSILQTQHGPHCPEGEPFITLRCRSTNLMDDSIIPRLFVFGYPVGVTASWVRAPLPLPSMDLPWWWMQPRHCKNPPYFEDPLGLIISYSTHFLLVQAVEVLTASWVEGGETLRGHLNSTTLMPTTRLLYTYIHKGARCPSTWFALKR